MQDIVALLGHPEKFNHDTLQQLREAVSAYPYFQAARLALLHNLYLLHDPTFGEELRNSALFLPDRRVLFDLIEGKHYRIEPPAIKQTAPTLAPEGSKERMTSLIDNFFSSLGESSAQQSTPTKGDVSSDYSAFLLQMDDLEPEVEAGDNLPRSQHLIEGYIDKPAPSFTLGKSLSSPLVADEEFLNNDTEGPVEEETPTSPAEETDKAFLTETLAKIYIKQGKYEKAIEIIRGLHLIYPKKNRYFADQIRFLQKLIINRNSTKEHV